MTSRIVGAARTCSVDPQPQEKQKRGKNGWWMQRYVDRPPPPPEKNALLDPNTIFLMR